MINGSKTYTPNSYQTNMGSKPYLPQCKKVSCSVNWRKMQSLIISWAVCVRLALRRKNSGANVLAVGKVICDTSIILALAGTRN